MTVQLQQRRSELEQQIIGLKRKRGEHQLDHEPTAGESAAILRAQVELDALNEAEGVAAERERAEAEARRLARLAELRTKLAELELQRLEQVEMAEMAARNLVDAVNRMLDINKQMGAIAHSISGDPTPAPLAQIETVSRMACRLGGVLSTIKSGSHTKFGYLQFMATGLYPPTHNWAEQEQNALGPHLAPLIAGAKPKAKATPLMIAHRKDDANDDAPVKQ